MWFIYEGSTSDEDLDMDVVGVGHGLGDRGRRFPARAEVLEKSAKVSGVTVQYKVVLPDGYDSTKAYPGIIALGGGPQTMNTVDGV